MLQTTSNCTLRFVTELVFLRHPGTARAEYVFHLLNGKAKRYFPFSKPRNIASIVITANFLWPVLFTEVPRVRVKYNTTIKSDYSLFAPNEGKL